MAVNSGELRRLQPKPASDLADAAPDEPGVQSPRPELVRSDSHELSPTEQEMVAAIERRIALGDFHTIGQGRSADVYKLDIWDEPEVEQLGLRPWVIKSELRPTLQKTAVGNTLETEMLLQQTAHDIIAAAQEQSPDLPFARIPKPISLFCDTERQWLLMEYMEGDTLFERAVRAWVMRFRDPSFVDERDEPDGPPLHAWHRDRLIRALQDNDLAPMLPQRPGPVDPAAERDVDEQVFPGLALVARRERADVHGEEFGILTPRQFQALKNTLVALHKAGFWHRDVHPSNVVLLEADEVALIDFGLSLHDPERLRRSVDPHDRLYELESAFGMVLLPKDDQLLPILDKLTRPRR